MSIIETHSKNRPNLIREKLSWFLVKLAYKIYPQSDEVKAFYQQAIMDYAIQGQHIVRVNPEDLRKESK
jgi:hypothetical protein